MSQSLSQYLGQHMRLEQRLTPQLIQSMNILQLGVTDLESLIAQELEKNGALELAEPEGGKGAVGVNGAEPDGNGVAPGDGVDATSPSFTRLDRLAREYELDFEDAGSSFRRGAPEDRDSKLDAMANTAGRGITLQEFLLEQWSMLELPDDVRGAGELIINHLDESGYLRIGLEELAAKSKPPTPLPVLEEALFQVQLLDPPGVGARDLKECLLLQVEALPGDNRIERAIIEHHLDEAARNMLPAIAKATGFSIAEVSAALDVIRKQLHPHPGRQVVDRSEPPIRPDVIVEYADTGGGLTVRLAKGNEPRLRISPQYLEMARSKQTDKEVRDFARKGIEAAGALMDAVQFRRNRLLDVANIIVDRQREFFEIGPQGLRPLRMSEIAEQLQCDPSTVSRTVADKYMQTPRGIFPLRSFFTGGTETDAGEVTSWDSVRNRVAEIIKAENPHDPLNDDQIVELLKKEGIEISRRTVAKYRQVLDIPPARRRKRF